MRGRRLARRIFHPEEIRGPPDRSGRRSGIFPGHAPPTHSPHSPRRCSASRRPRSRTPPCRARAAPSAPAYRRLHLRTDTLSVFDQRMDVQVTLVDRADQGHRRRRLSCQRPGLHRVRAPPSSATRAGSKGCGSRAATRTTCSQQHEPARELPRRPRRRRDVRRPRQRGVQRSGRRRHLARRRRRATASSTSPATTCSAAGPHGHDQLRGAPSAVSVTLIDDVQFDDGRPASDRLVGVENLIGSAYNDSLTGTDGPNVIPRAPGWTRLRALGGDDAPQRPGGRRRHRRRRRHRHRHLRRPHRRRHGLTRQHRRRRRERRDDNVRTDVENVEGGSGPDTFIAQASTPVRTAQWQRRRRHLNAGAGDDEVNGGAGNDTSSAPPGTDQYDGEAGIDTLDYSSRSGEFTEDITITLANRCWSRATTAAPSDGPAGNRDNARNFEGAMTGDGNDIVTGTDSPAITTGHGVDTSTPAPATTSLHPRRQEGQPRRLRDRHGHDRGRLPARLQQRRRAPAARRLRDLPAVEAPSSGPSPSTITSTRPGHGASRPATGSAASSDGCS